MRKRWVWGLICLLLCLLPACGQEKPAANDVPPASESPVEAAPQKREADFSAAFGGIQGCAVLSDIGVVSFAVGFMVMMALDVALG